jgi:hypothetical protein
MQYGTFILHFGNKKYYMWLLVNMKIELRKQCWWTIECISFSSVVYTTIPIRNSNMAAHYCYHIAFIQCASHHIYGCIFKSILKQNKTDLALVTRQSNNSSWSWSTGANVACHKLWAIHVCVGSRGRKDFWQWRFYSKLCYLMSNSIVHKSDQIFFVLNEKIQSYIIFTYQCTYIWLSHF